jgi:hypothetical protein
MINQIELHSWKGIITTDTKEEDRLIELKMHCYKYELQFNSYDKISEDQLALVEHQLNKTTELMFRNKKT